jgi:hypothetical protein
MAPFLSKASADASKILRPGTSGVVPNSTDYSVPRCAVTTSRTGMDGNCNHAKGEVAQSQRIFLR